MHTGSCLCKGYRFEVSGDYTGMAACHCSICRRSTGTDYAAFATCAKGDFKPLQGDDLISRFKSSERGERRFCKVCGSSLPFDFGETVYIPSGLLDGDPGVRVGMHIFVGSKAPWVEIHGEAPQFEEFPPHS